MNAHRIPGVPGATEPTFRTGDRRWMGLDSLVWETCARLEERRQALQPAVVKAVIQVARMAVQGPERLEGQALVDEVTLRLRHERVLLPAARVRAVLLAYLTVVGELEIQEINEIV